MLCSLHSVQKHRPLNWQRKPLQAVTPVLHLQPMERRSVPQNRQVLRAFGLEGLVSVPGLGSSSCHRDGGLAVSKSSCMLRHAAGIWTVLRVQAARNQMRGVVAPNPILNEVRLCITLMRFGRAEGLETPHDVFKIGSRIDTYYIGTAGNVSAQIIRRYIMECQGV